MVWTFLFMTFEQNKLLRTPWFEYFTEEWPFQFQNYFVDLFFNFFPSCRARLSSVSVSLANFTNDKNVLLIFAYRVQRNKISQHDWWKHIRWMKEQSTRKNLARHSINTISSEYCKQKRTCHSKNDLINIQLIDSSVIPL